MKKINQTQLLFFIFLFLINSTGSAQNVGIGTTTFATGEKLSIAANGVQIGIYPGYRDNIPAPNWATIDMLGIGNVRFWDSVSVNGAFYSTGTVGIGIVPSNIAPLTFANASGQKISFFPDQPEGYTVGVEMNEFRFAGGTGASDALTFRTQGYNGTERMRISGDGNVRVGKTLSVVDDGGVIIGIFPGYRDGVTDPDWTTFDMPGVKNVRLWDNVSVSGSVGLGTYGADASALLDVSSTTQGLLPPRMTTAQRDAIASPATGLVLFNTTSNSLEIKNSSGWASLGTAADALPTIQIGTQKWMSKNLDVAYYRNGDPIPQVTDQTEWANLTTGAWCYYNNDSTSANKYGKMYNWYAVNDPRGLAPQGWHIPSDAEWTALETTLGGSSVAGGKLKEAGTSSWTSPNTAANNMSAFTALPGGTRQSNGFFCGCLGSYGLWWSSTENNSTFAWLRQLYALDGIVSRLAYMKTEGYSVRCIRN